MPTVANGQGLSAFRISRDVRPRPTYDFARRRPGDAVADDAPAAAPLPEARLERAVGDIYVPNTERQSHHFTSRVGARFDAAVFVDEAKAVTPLP